MVSPTASPARSDAGVQHVGIQFGKGSGEHLRFTEAGRERLVMERTTLPAFFASHGGKPCSSSMGRLRHRNRRTGFSYACWLSRGKKQSLSQRDVAIRNFRMNNVIVPALTGIFGSLLGGAASVTTAWVTQRTSNKRKEFRAELTRRETLYGQFINECSARALDSFENTLDKSERLLLIYALLNRIRLCASDAVLTEAERALAAITEQYFRPNLSLEQLHALIRDGANGDPLKSFAEACRAELKSIQAAL
jgi:hypothetical protein